MTTASAHRPALTETVRRPHLEMRLEAAPLVVVRGPRGAGKTMLAATWAARADGDDERRWARLPVGHDVRAVWAAVVGALGGTVDPGADVAALQRRARSLGGALARPTCLVLDGLDLVDAPAPSRDLAELVRRTRHLRMVVTTRTWATEDVLAGVEVDVERIGPDELRLDIEEVASLLALVGDGAPTGVAERLRHHSGGWVEACRVMVEGIEAARGPTAVDHEGREILASWVDEVVVASGIDDAVAAAAAMLGELDVGSLGVVLGEQVDEAQVQRLEQVGLAYITQDRPGVVRPRPVEYLGATVHRTWLPDRLRALDVELANWLLAQGRPEPALRHAGRAQAWTLVAELVEDHLRALLLDHEEALRAVVATVPAAVLRDLPGLRDVRTMVLELPIDGELDPAVVPADPEQLAAAAAGPGLYERLTRAFAQMGAQRFRGNLVAAAELARRIRTLLDAASARVDELADLPPVLLFQGGISRLLVGEVRTAESEVLAGYSAATAAGAVDGMELLARNSATYEAMIRALSGDVEGTTSWLARSRRHRHPPPPEWLAAVLPTSGDVAAAIVALDLLDRQAATERVGAAGDPTRDDELWALVAHVHARFALLWGDRAEARCLLDRARSVQRYRAGPGSLAYVLLAMDTVDLLLADGRLVEAEEVLAGVSGIAPAVVLRRARSALLRGRFREVVSLAAPAGWSEHTSARERAELLVVLALAADLDDQVELARTAATRAAALVRVTGALSVFAVVPVGARDRLAELLAPEDVKLVAATRETAEVLPAVPPKVELTVRESEVLEHLARGDTLRQIAAAQYVSPNTVKSQVRALYRKLGVSSRGDAVAVGIDLGLLES